MIGGYLPRLALRPGASTYTALEAFSYVYLAKYNLAAAHARSEISLRKAWGHSWIKFKQRVPGGRPAYVIVGYEDDPIGRVMVCIEGTTTLGQLRTTWASFNAVPYGALAGEVLAAFGTHANTIWAELMADDDVMRIINGYAQKNLVFAGFSLGAAIAEVLSVKAKVTYPAAHILLRKFGAPKTGTMPWANARHHVANRGSYYMAFDPIHIFPFVTMYQISSRAISWGLNGAYYADATPVIRLDRRGDPHLTPMGDNYYNFVGSSVGLLRTMDENNSWIYHDPRHYRTMFSAWVMLKAREWRTRFMFLEYPDCNSWGQLYRPGNQFDPAWIVEADPVPADEPVPHDELEPPVLGQARMQQAIPNDQQNQGQVLEAPTQWRNPTWRPRSMGASPMRQR